MEHVNLLISALKHFIRYNKNKVGKKMRLKNYDGDYAIPSGLCGYIYIYTNAKCPPNDYDSTLRSRNLFATYMNLEVAKSDFKPWLHSYKFDCIVTKKRLKVAQKILKKLEKDLKSGKIEENEANYE